MRVRGPLPEAELRVYCMKIRMAGLAAALAAGCGAMPLGKVGEAPPAVRLPARATQFVKTLRAEAGARRLAGAWSDDGVRVIARAGLFLPAGGNWKDTYGSALPALGLGVKGSLPAWERAFYLAGIEVVEGPDEVESVGATRITHSLSYLELRGTLCFDLGPLFLGGGVSVALVKEEVTTGGLGDASRETTGTGYHVLAGCRKGSFLVGTMYRFGFEPEGLGVFGGWSF